MKCLDKDGKEVTCTSTQFGCQYKWKNASTTAAAETTAGCFNIADTEEGLCKKTETDSMVRI